MVNKILSLSRFRIAKTVYGHAVPFYLMGLCAISGSSSVVSGPVDCMARGISVPIPGGGPPILQE